MTQLILVTDQNGEIDDIGEATRENLVQYLHNTSSKQYSDQVLSWFDSGHVGQFKIKNGEEDDCFDVWEVVDTSSIGQDSTNT